MAGVRVLTSSRVSTVGQPVGIQVSTFGLRQLQTISGADLEPIITEALQPALEQLQADWPVDTGASVDSARIETDEVEERSARVSLRIGGEPLINDPRNVKKIDYAPYLEFNGSPGGTPPGVMLYAMSANRTLMRDTIHEAVALLIQERLRG